ncbi:hypothetical protein M231_07766 [Tremella mesenterica]|uniref:SMP domain-containing protein n=1 Tax=Tremella mesenterica TaxID=5217 RepID=A0A4Q1BFM9_TREME|nr:uncharacterized protein TREMEDRAFT_56617 [Tremella mesenterica DSM 1558]EIW70554.1 hypothetical protein TREMEDRAFT_56617 [Tremella mesenterica DSM 1558]RXK34983.1 hypothetical protein M231_07766 [Tremella mesenterica]
MTQSPIKENVDPLAGRASTTAGQPKQVPDDEQRGPKTKPEQTSGNATEEDLKAAKAAAEAVQGEGSGGNLSRKDVEQAGPHGAT